MNTRVGFLLVVLLLGCSNDNSTGSAVFIAEDLMLDGNPSILGESSGTAETPAGFIRLGGVVDSQSRLPLTGLKVRVRILGANNIEMAVREQACNPVDIGPGGSCTFLLTVALIGFDFRDSQQIEITPICDQGAGTIRTIPVIWPEA